MQPITVSTTSAANAATFSRPVRMDSWANGETIIQVKVGGTANYTVQGSMDDPNSVTDPVPVANMTWIDCSAASLVNAAANAQGTLTATPIFLRLKQNSGNGTATMTVAQFSNAPL